MKYKAPHLGILMLVAPLLMGASVLKPVDTREFEQVRFYAPMGTAKDFAFVFTGEDGLTNQDTRAIDRLTDAGVFVAEIDTQTALKNLNHTDSDHGCMFLAGPLEYLSHNAQADPRFAHYVEPVLLGRGAGAALVYAALAQAPPLAFAGGISVDFQPVATVPRKPCDMSVSRIDKNAIALAPDNRLRGRWLINNTLAPAPGLKAFAQQATLANSSASVQVVGSKNLATLYRETAVALRERPKRAGNAVPVDDLPLVEVSKDSKNNTLIIVYSGDGGWRDLDRTLGDLFAKQNYAVLGMDTRRYFWSKRTPDEAARDLARTIQHYRVAWKIERIVLVGYSFGAEVLPFAYRRLAKEQRDSVYLLSLLEAGRDAEFEITLSGWLGGRPSPIAIPLAPEMAMLKPAKIQCIFGAENAGHSLCTTPELAKAQIVKRPGGHRFDEDYVTLAQVIVDRIAQRIADPPGSDYENDVP